MINPMLNPRRAPGLRGEQMVARMRVRATAGDRRRGRRVVEPSLLKADKLGTVSRKDFTGGGTASLPTRAAPMLGGLQSMSFGD